MGNTEPGNSKPVFQQWKLVQRLSERRSLINCPSKKKEFVLIESTFPSEEQLSACLSSLNASFTLTHPYYLNLLHHQTLSLSTLCSKQYKLQRFYPYEPRTLLVQYQNRVKQGRGFARKQIWSILCSCVLVMSWLVKKDQLHYTVGLQDIIIDGQGVCKVQAADASDNQFDYSQRETFYYSPQAMKLFASNTPAAVSSLNSKSGVFTLAVSILHLVLMQPMNHLYEFAPPSIDYASLTQHIYQVMDDDLQLILSKMLKVHTYERIAWTELEEMLYEVLMREGHSDVRSRRSQEGYQISRLEESILRIKGGKSSQKSLRVSRNADHGESQTNFQKNYHFNFESHALLASPADQEDHPHEILILSLPDLQIIDEEELAFPSSIQVNETHSEIPNNTLMEKSNFTNLTYQISQKFMNSDQNPVKNFKNDVTSSRNMKKSSTSIEQSDTNRPHYCSEEHPGGRYEGYKLGNYRHGFGTFYYREGGKYSGEWEYNQMQGRGALYYISGKIAYEGEWRKDKLHGYGVLYNQKIAVINEPVDWHRLAELGGEWIKYQGGFEEDVKQGEGSLFLSNGESFRGGFQDDLPHGEGIYRTMAGQAIRGYWIKGILMSP